MKTENLFTEITTSPRKLQGERNYYIDTLKGITIIIVIFIHTVWAYPGDTMYVPLSFANFTLLFEVPIFFFLAGWSYSYSKGPKSYLKSLLVTQIKYMIFMVLIYIAICITNGIGVSHNPVTLQNLLRWFIHDYTLTEPFGGVYYSLWFFRVYFFVALLGATLIKVLKTNVKEYVMIACFLGVFLFTFIMPDMQNINLGIELEKLLFYLFFYLLGNATKDKTISIWQCIALFGITILGLVFVRYGLNRDITNLQMYKFPPNFIYLLWSLFGVFIVLYVKRFFNFCKKNIFSMIGRYSIYIYLAQMIGDSALCWISKYIGMQWYYKMFVMFGINLAITAVVTIILKLILEPIGKWTRRMLDEKIFV